jgi:hypothetical protein
MKCNIRTSLLALVLTGTCWLGQEPAKASDYWSEESTLRQTTGSGVKEYRYMSTRTIRPADSTETVVVEKPVYIENMEKTVEKEIIRERVGSAGKSATKSVIVRKAARKALPAPAGNRIISRLSTVEKTIERPVVVEKPVIVEKPVYVDRVVETPVYRDRIVEKPVYIDRTVEKPVYIDRTVEKPVYIEKSVEVEKPVVIEKPVVVEKKVVIYKRPHHLFHLGIL